MSDVEARMLASDWGGWSAVGWWLLLVLVPLLFGMGLGWIALLWREAKEPREACCKCGLFHPLSKIVRVHLSPHKPASTMCRSCWNGIVYPRQCNAAPHHLGRSGVGGS